jgi:hypothetical protein
MLESHKEVLALLLRFFYLAYVPMFLVSHPSGMIIGLVTWVRSDPSFSGLCLDSFYQGLLDSFYQGVIILVLRANTEIRIRSSAKLITVSSSLGDANFIRIQRQAAPRPSSRPVGESCALQSTCIRGHPDHCIDPIGSPASTWTMVLVPGS